jgi:hypothetical protein
MRNVVNFEDAKKGALICGKSDHYNGGKEFTGNITRIRGDLVFFTTKNGRSRQSLNISQWSEYEISQWED